MNSSVDSSRSPVALVDGAAGLAAAIPAAPCRPKSLKGRKIGAREAK